MGFGSPPPTLSCRSRADWAAPDSRGVLALPAAGCPQLTLLEGPGLLGAGQGHGWGRGQGDPRGAEISAWPPEPQPDAGPWGPRGQAPGRLPSAAQTEVHLLAGRLGQSAPLRGRARLQEGTPKPGSGGLGAPGETWLGARPPWSLQRALGRICPTPVLRAPLCSSHPQLPPNPGAPWSHRSPRRAATSPSSGWQGKQPFRKAGVAVGVPGSGLRRVSVRGAAPGGRRVPGVGAGLVFGVCPCLSGAGSRGALLTPAAHPPAPLSASGPSLPPSSKAPGGPALFLDVDPRRAPAPAPSPPARESHALFCVPLPPWSARTLLPSRSCTTRRAWGSAQIPFPRTGGSLPAWEGGLSLGLTPTPFGCMRLAFPATTPPPLARQRPEGSGWGFPGFLLWGLGGSEGGGHPGGATRLRHFGQCAGSFPFKGTSGAACCAGPERWL